MEKQTVYLVSPIFTSQTPLVSGSPVDLLEKVSGRACVMPACSSITDVCVQRISTDELDGDDNPCSVMIGVFGDNGSTHCRFSTSDLNDTDICHLCCCCPYGDVHKSSVNDLTFQIDLTGGGAPTLNQGQLAVVIKYVPMPLGPKSTKSTPREPIKYKVYNAPFGAPTGQV